MNLYSGRVRRDLSERRFNKVNPNYCCTGGSNLGCPFLRTNKRIEMICTLYRSKPMLGKENQFHRVVPCKENTEAPAIRNYVIHASKNIIAASSEEARKLFCQTFREGITINTVEEGQIAEYENIF